MSLQEKLSDLATRIGTEFKTVRTEVSTATGNLASLDTTAKTDLVAAINEVNLIAETAAGGGVAIDDENVSDSTTYSSEKIEDLVSNVEVDLTDLIDDTTPGTDTVYSSSKTDSQISSAVSALVNSAPSTLDTLKELSDALGGDAAFSTTVSTALGNRVRTDTASQGLDSTSQSNARTNIGAASSSALTTLTTNVGDTTTDYVTIFEAGLD